jgi:hypothetical protein
VSGQDSSSTRADLKFSWQRALQAALVEVDPHKLAECVKEAEGAIFLRQQELIHGSDAQVEQHALEDAMRSLRVIQQSLEYPDRSKE